MNYSDLFRRHCHESLHRTYSMQYVAIGLMISLLVQSAAGCSGSTTPAISGKIQLKAGWKPVIYLVKPRSFSEIASGFSGLVVDSARLAEDGYFAFPALQGINEPTLLQLCIQQENNRYPNQLLDDDPAQANYMPVIVNPGITLEITAESARFQSTFSIKKPSGENLSLLHLRDIRQQAWQQEGAVISAHADENTLQDHEDAIARFRKPLMAFADSTSHFLAAMVAVRWVSTTGDYERVPEFVFRQCEKWRGTPGASWWVTQLCQLAQKENLPVLTGDVIPDFPMPMASGDTLMLHTLLGSRVTVLDIWASWCAPCRRENRDVLSPLRKQYNEKDLQILGYSIDASPGAWKAAIAKDGANWSQASHLTGDTSPFTEALRITTIPANFILDEQGKVVAKNLHGELLRAFVAERLK